MILAVDPATRLGWCTLEPGGTPEAGSIRLGRAHCELGEALAELRAWLEDTIDQAMPSLIVFEAPYVPTPRRMRIGKAGTLFAHQGAPQAVAGPPMNAATIERLCSIAGVIQMAAHEHGIECRSCISSQATGFFTGKTRWGGREKKKTATVEMCRRLGYEACDDNAADAIAIAMFAESQWFPREAAKRAIGLPLLA